MSEYQRNPWDRKPGTRQSASCHPSRGEWRAWACTSGSRSKASRSDSLPCIPDLLNSQGKKKELWVNFKRRFYCKDVHSSSNLLSESKTEANNDMLLFGFKTDFEKIKELCFIYTDQTFYSLAFSQIYTWCVYVSWFCTFLDVYLSIHKKINDSVLNSWICFTIHLEHSLIFPPTIIPTYKIARLLSSPFFIYSLVVPNRISVSGLDLNLFR